MPTDRSALDGLMARLGYAQEVSSRAMMGEYVLYFEGITIGGLYDGRLLVKPTKNAKALLHGAAMELPYDGARPMLRVPDGMDSERILALFRTVAKDVPPRRRRAN